MPDPVFAVFGAALRSVRVAGEFAEEVDVRPTADASPEVAEARFPLGDRSSGVASSTTFLPPLAIFFAVVVRSFSRESLGARGSRSDDDALDSSSETRATLPPANIPVGLPLGDEIELLGAYPPPPLRLASASTPTLRFFAGLGVGETSKRTTAARSLICFGYEDETGEDEGRGEKLSCVWRERLAVGESFIVDARARRGGFDPPIGLVWQDLSLAEGGIRFRSWCGEVLAFKARFAEGCCTLGRARRCESGGRG